MFMKRKKQIYTKKITYFPKAIFCSKQESPNSRYNGIEHMDIQKINLSRNQETY